MVFKEILHFYLIVLKKMGGFINESTQRSAIKRLTYELL